MQTKPLAVVCTPTCAVESHGASATSAEVRAAEKIPFRSSISERPSHIVERKQVGDWEGDALIDGAHKQAIVTLVERKSGFALLAKVPNK